MRSAIVTGYGIKPKFIDMVVGREAKKDIEGITLPVEKEWMKNVYWMYSILVEDKFGMSRDDLMKRLEEKGIDTRPFFYPMHVMPPHKNNEEFPVAEEISRKGVNLPSGVNLTEEKIKQVVDTIIGIKS
ncbi:MAG: DegT/DnrJ/EryC1/StrS family aminotransferase [Halobacteriota archaeon]